MPGLKEKYTSSVPQQKDIAGAAKDTVKTVDELIADMNRFSQEVLRKHEERIKIWR